LRVRTREDVRELLLKVVLPVLLYLVLAMICLIMAAAIGKPG
jgi:hypothetical protein